MSNLFAFMGTIRKLEQQKGYEVIFSEVPGCSARGRTFVEVEHNAQNALQTYFDDAYNANLPLPQRSRDLPRSGMWIMVHVSLPRERSEDVLVPAGI